MGPKAGQLGWAVGVKCCGGRKLWCPQLSTPTPKVVVPATFGPKVVVPATLTPGTTTTQCSRGGGRRRGHGKWSERDVLRRSWVVGAGSRRSLLWWVGEGKDGDESVGVKAMMSGVGMPGAGDKAPGTGKGSPQVWEVWGESPEGWPRAGPGAVGVTNKVRKAWELHQVPVDSRAPPWPPPSAGKTTEVRAGLLKGHPRGPWTA